MTAYPKGLGIFCRGAAIRPAVLRASRARWAAIMVEGTRGAPATRFELARQAALAREGGVREVWVWSLFGERAALEPTVAAKRLGDAMRATSAAGMILDVEAAHKGRGPQTRALAAAAIDELTEKTGIGVTSYPIPRAHPTLAWPALRVGFGMPQLYDTAADRRKARAALADWRDGWPDVPGRAGWGPGRQRVVVPVLAVYDTKAPGEGAEQLRGDIERVLVDDAGKVDVPGVAIWSEPQIGPDETAVLRDLVERAGW